MAKCFVVLNADTSIHTVSEKNDNVIGKGQKLLVVESTMNDFVSSLPASPSLCKMKSGGKGWTKFKEEENKKQYSSIELKTWAMQQVFAGDLATHYAAFLDFANNANDQYANLLLQYSAMFKLEDMAKIIIAKAKELGAKIS